MFTFAELLGEPQCRVPDAGYSWQHTRQPVYLPFWEEVVSTPGGTLHDGHELGCLWLRGVGRRELGPEERGVSADPRPPISHRARLRGRRSRLPTRSPRTSAACGWTVVDPAHPDENDLELSATTSPNSRGRGHRQQAGVRPIAQRLVPRAQRELPGRRPGQHRAGHGLDRGHSRRATGSSPSRTQEEAVAAVRARGGRSRWAMASPPARSPPSTSTPARSSRRCSRTQGSIECRPAARALPGSPEEVPDPLSLHRRRGPRCPDARTTRGTKGHPWSERARLAAPRAGRRCGGSSPGRGVRVVTQGGDRGVSGAGPGLADDGRDDDRPAAARQPAGVHRDGPARRRPR